MVTCMALTPAEQHELEKEGIVLSDGDEAVHVMLRC